MTFVNPEPLAPFADVITAGEGEVLIPALMRALGDASDRHDLYRRLAAERGFYIPSFYDVRYGGRRHASRRSSRGPAPARRRS